MAGSNYERILAAEWLVVMATETLDALSQASETQFALPTPSVYFATMVVYLMLAAVAMFGERPGRLAAAFGGVAGLAILLAPTSKGKRSPVVGALGYFAQLMKSGPNMAGPAGAPPPAGSPAAAQSDINKLGAFPGQPVVGAVAGNVTTFAGSVASAFGFGGPAPTNRPPSFGR